MGHAGTLDPLASGVLVVCLGAATRLIEYVQRMPKTYRTVVRLGARSDTLDADGRIVETDNPGVPGEAEVRAVLMTQIGTIAQRPPEYSALKVDGRRAYDLARAGESVALAPRPVRIDRVELVAYAWPRLELEIDCGGGTYIRSIARDVGDALGCGGLVEVLVRTRIGPFTLGEALDPVDLTAQSIAASLGPPLLALAEFPRLNLSEAQAVAIARGQAVDRLAVPGAEAVSGEVALLGPDGALLAVAEADPEGLIRPRRVLAGA